MLILASTSPQWPLYHLDRVYASPPCRIRILSEFDCSEKQKRIESIRDSLLTRLQNRHPGETLEGARCKSPNSVRSSDSGERQWKTQRRLKNVLDKATKWDYNSRWRCTPAEFSESRLKHTSTCLMREYDTARFSTEYRRSPSLSGSFRGLQLSSSHCRFYALTSSHRPLFLILCLLFLAGGQSIRPGGSRKRVNDRIQ